jgi:hypothetical protein
MYPRSSTSTLFVSGAVVRGCLQPRTRDQRRGRGVDDNARSNVVLLDISTNRSYKNAIFPVKRTRIIVSTSRRRERSASNISSRSETNGDSDARPCFETKASRRTSYLQVAPEHDRRAARACARRRSPRLLPLRCHRTFTEYLWTDGSGNCATFMVRSAAQSCASRIGNSRAESMSRQRCSAQEERSPSVTDGEGESGRHGCLRAFPGRCSCVTTARNSWGARRA